jgi:hypothetical protein
MNQDSNVQKRLNGKQGVGVEDGVMISWDAVLDPARNSSKFDHVLLVWAIMKELARRLGEDGQGLAQDSQWLRF